MCAFVRVCKVAGRLNSHLFGWLKRFVGASLIVRLSVPIFSFQFTNCRKSFIFFLFFFSFFSNNLYICFIWTLYYILPFEKNQMIILKFSCYFVTPIISIAGSV
jgi:hypothetical protein